MELTLRLLMPDGNIEHITVDATRAGMVVLTKMLPLKQKYVLPEELKILRPDGMALHLEVPLSQQGLRPDDLLQVAEILGKVSPAVNGYPRIESEMLEREAFSTQVSASAACRSDVRTEDETKAGASTRRPDARAESEMKVARWQEMQLLLRAEEALKDGGEEVVEAFNEALEVLPSHLELDQEQRALAAQAFFGRARAHFRQRHWQAALDDARRSLEFAPSLDAMCCEALSLKELGQMEPARARLGLVLLKDPSHKVAKNALAAMKCMV